MSKRIRQNRKPAKSIYPFPIGANIVAFPDSPYSITDSSVVCKVVFQLSRKETIKNIKTSKYSPGNVVIDGRHKFIGNGQIGTDIVVKTIAKLNRHGSFIDTEYYWVSSKFFRKLTYQEAIKTFDIPF